MENKTTKSFSEEQKSRFFYVMGEGFSKGTKYGINTVLSLLSVYDIEIPEQVMDMLNENITEADEAIEELKLEEKERLDALFGSSDDDLPF